MAQEAKPRWTTASALPRKTSRLTPPSAPAAGAERGERVLLLAVLAAIVVVSAGAFAPAPLLRLEVVGGRTLHLAVPEDNAFVYRYQHSVYDVLVEERFAVEGETLRQVEIRRADRKALEYYGLPYELERKGGVFVTKGRPEKMPQIDLVVLGNQDQEIVLDSKRFDLSQKLGDVRLVLPPVQSFRAAALLSRVSRSRGRRVSGCEPIE